MIKESVVTDLLLDSDEATQRQRNRARNQAAIALLAAWRAEDAALSPAEAAAAEAEWEELKQALNANRAPAPPLFP